MLLIKKYTSCNKKNVRDYDKNKEFRLKIHKSSEILFNDLNNASDYSDFLENYYKGYNDFIQKINVSNFIYADKYFENTKAIFNLNHELIYFAFKNDYNDSENIDMDFLKKERFEMQLGLIEHFEKSVSDYYNSLERYNKIIQKNNLYRNKYRCKQLYKSEIDLMISVVNKSFIATEVLDAFECKENLDKKDDKKSDVIILNNFIMNFITLNSLGNIIYGFGFKYSQFIKFLNNNENITKTTKLLVSYFISCNYFTNYENLKNLKHDDTETLKNIILAIKNDITLDLNNMIDNFIIDVYKADSNINKKSFIEVYESVKYIDCFDWNFIDNGIINVYTKEKGDILFNLITNEFNNYFTKTVNCSRKFQIVRFMNYFSTFINLDSCKYKKTTQEDISKIRECLKFDIRKEMTIKTVIGDVKQLSNIFLQVKFYRDYNILDDYFINKLKIVEFITLYNIFNYKREEYSILCLGSHHKEVAKDYIKYIKEIYGNIENGSYTLEKEYVDKLNYMKDIFEINSSDEIICGNVYDFYCDFIKLENLIMSDDYCL